MIEEVETALALDPLSLAINHSLAEAYFAARRDDDATAQLRRTLDLDPSFRAALETLGWVQTRAGHLEEALGSFERMAALSPNRYSGAAGRGYVLARLGRQEESRAVLALLEERRRTEPRVLTAIDTATVHLGLGELDAVFDDIGRAMDARAGQTVFLRTERQWDDLRPDPRFAGLLARIAPTRPAQRGESDRPPPNSPPVFR
jgi:tetratricopeptide (TPR) repeat protein